MAVDSRDEILPALRPLDITHVAGPDGQPYFLINDMARVSPQPLGVSATAYYALASLDGQHSCADIQEVYLRELGVIMPAEQILQLVDALNQACMLQNERYEQALGQIRDDYATTEVRDGSMHYKDDPPLRDTLLRILEDAEPTARGPIVGLIAPHLDYQRGAPCYAAAYQALADAGRADRYIILGTNHAGSSADIVATDKPFLTPLALARTDVDFLHRLEERLGRDLQTDQHEHIAEHSVELQVHFLQVLHGDHPFEIVPLLCPSPAHDCAGDSADTIRQRLDDFAAAMRAEIDADDRRTVIIAGADLSHVGQRFGDVDPTTPEFLQQVEQADREMLSLIETGAVEEFLDRLRANDNATRICSTGCLYVLTKAFPGRRVELLAYHQALDHENEMHVTCAAGVVPRE